MIIKKQAARFERALCRVGDDYELLARMAKLAADDGPPLADKLDGFLNNPVANDAATTCPQVLAACHRLKGILCTFETEHPVSNLSLLLAAARSGSLAQSALLWSECRSEVYRLFNEIADLAANRSG